MAKLNFDGKKKRVNSSKVGMDTKSYEELLEKRESQMEELMDGIQQMFEDWTGEVMAIVIVEEDENGMPTGTRSMIAGAGRVQSQVRLAQALDKTSEQALKVLAEGVASPGSKKEMLAATKQIIGAMGIDEEEED